MHNPCEDNNTVDTSVESACYGRYAGDEGVQRSRTCCCTRTPLGSAEDELPLMETMYMVHEDDDISPCLLQDGHVDHMDPPTSTTPTSNESAYKGNNIGVDDAMIPLVDMMNFECMHDLDDPFATSHATFTFPCDALLDNIVDHVELIACDTMTMPCYEIFTFSPHANDNDHACVVTPLMNTCSFNRVVDNNDNISFRMLCPKCLHHSMILASKIVNNCSFLCLVCKNAYFVVHEMAPIAFSIFDGHELPHAMNAPSCHMHHRHAFHTILIDTNGDVHKTWNIMMDDVFLYHAHTLFVFSFVCIRTRMTTSTATEHELTKRAI
nr:uncharacterized protein LOC127295098 [Lolium perenne]